MQSRLKCNNSGTVQSAITDTKMIHRIMWIIVIILVFKSIPCDSIFLVIPEDVATGFAAIYGFSPRILKGNDHRFGFGFRFGNHADLQILYEIGPQLTTKPVQPLRVRSATYRERTVRRRPLIDFLLRTGFLKEAEYEYNFNNNECDEPR